MDGVGHWPAGSVHVVHPDPHDRNVWDEEYVGYGRTLQVAVFTTWIHYLTKHFGLGFKVNNRANP